MMFPSWALRTIRRDIRFIESFKLIIDPNFYKDLRTIRLQRQVNDAQANFFLNFLVPISNGQGQWLVYEIDDVIGKEDIPPYNNAKSAFQNDAFFANVQKMLHATDFMTVTTDELKNYYHTKYGVDNNKIMVIPNYLPRWWIGETYSLSKQTNLLQENIKKPRVGFPMSSSHFDIKGQNGYVDDFTHIVDFVRSTVNEYQWVFKGHVPKQLEDLARDKKIEIVPGSDLLNYPRELWRLNLQAIVAPLQDNIFNRCKSNIKLIESWALGIPVIAQDLPCYSPYTDRVFKDANGLQNQLDDLFKDKGKYKKIVKDNRHIVDYGDHSLAPNGWWLEKNLMQWLKISTLPQKTLRFDLKKVKEHLNKKEEGVKLEL